jgi:P27 family predicted phage terminase small subunit
MRGGDRKSKSVEQHKADGTYREDRHGGKVKAPTVEAIEPPAYFKGEHLDKWNEVCANLREFGILAVQDRDSIETYVSSILLQKKAWVQILENGFEVEGYPNPAIKIYQNLEGIIKPLREQFGFTPRARQGMQTKAKEPERVDPILAFLNPIKKKYDKAV